MQQPIAVFGAGSWGTALAVLLAKNGQPVVLWGHNADHVLQMSRERANARYLPGIAFPPALSVVPNIAEALSGSPDILLVTPSRAFVETLAKIKPYLWPAARLVWGTKGLTAEGELLHHACARVLARPHPLAILSGPSFAMEVARDLPTAVTVASSDLAFAQSLAARFSNTNFRVYTTDDMTGVEICGVIKNILAIAAGILDGLNLGANALSALITRGLVEMKRFGVALGGKPDTFIGLAGLGDLVLSCTDNQSRNRRFGRAIASGKKAEAILADMGQFVEGYYNLATAYQLAQQKNIEMPITTQVYQIIYEQKSPQLALQELLVREPRKESA
jgi:glycerol-3-phosphate dehydrogenase (NAD(P)+)